MRKSVIQATMVALSLMGSAAFAAGLIDHDGIEASRAGVRDRQPERFISTLVRGADGWEVEGLDADRSRCWNYQSVLKTAIRLSHKKKLTEEAIEDAVRQADMPEFCIMYVQNSAYTQVSYQLLLTPEGDVLFGYDDDHVAYIPWQKVDHLEAMFDTAIRDVYTIRGIAPAGETSQIVGVGGQAEIDTDWLADQAKEAAAKKRMEEISVPLPTFRPERTIGTLN